jgi:hypothetical protein
MAFCKHKRGHRMMVITYATLFKNNAFTKNLLKKGGKLPG